MRVEIKEHLLEMNEDSRIEPNGQEILVMMVRVILQPFTLILTINPY